MSEWKPIESALTNLAWSYSDYDKEKDPAKRTKFYVPALVYGSLWEGGWSDSPHEPEKGGGFTGEKIVAIASTYSGKGFWTLEQNYGPGDYDNYILPTHWMPLPDPPPAEKE